MPEVIFNGPEGRIEGKYTHSKMPSAPIALLMHPHPEHGGTMNNKIIFHMYKTFKELGFSTLRFNFRGVGRSQGVYDNGVGELSDAAAALDWLQTYNKSFSSCWVAGFSFGAWITMQLLMRRPEINNFIAVAPPANLFDFSFLAPCPTSGLILQGDKDSIVPEEYTAKLAAKLSSQRGIEVNRHVIEGANHFFEGKQEALMQIIQNYVKKHSSQNYQPSQQSPYSNSAAA